jgi:hypothetical protein
MAVDAKLEEPREFAIPGMCNAAGLPNRSRKRS